MFNATKYMKGKGGDPTKKKTTKKSTNVKPTYTPFKPPTYKHDKLIKKEPEDDERLSPETIRALFPPSETLANASLSKVKEEDIDFDKKPEAKPTVVDSDDELFASETEDEKVYPTSFCRRAYLNSPATSDFLNQKLYNTDSEADNSSICNFSLQTFKPQSVAVTPSFKFIEFKNSEELEKYPTSEISVDLTDDNNSLALEDFIQLFDRFAIGADNKRVKDKVHKAKKSQIAKYRCANKHILHQQYREQLGRQAAARHCKLIKKLSAKVKNLSVLEDKLKKFKVLKVAAGLGNLNDKDSLSYHQIRNEFKNIYGSQALIKEQLADYKREIDSIELEIEDLEEAHSFAQEEKSKKRSRGLKKGNSDANLQAEITEALDEYKIAKNTRSKSKSI